MTPGSNGEPARSVAIDAALVTRLIASQFPQWADLPITPAEPNGWDNRTFRLGAGMSVRLPSAARYAAQVEKEHRWLPVLAPQLPLPIPVPLAVWSPGRRLSLELVGLPLARRRPGDATIAWTLFSGESREAFRAALPVDAATWARGRGWALWKALITFSGSLNINSREAEAAGRVINDVLTEHEQSS